MHDFSDITILDHTLYFDCRTFFITMSSLGDLGLGRLAFLSSYDFGNIFYHNFFVLDQKNRFLDRIFELDKSNSNIYFFYFQYYQL